MDKLCSLCKKCVDSESAPILTIGGYGNPKYICEDCAADIEEVSSGIDVDSVKAAMARVADNMSVANVDDKTVLETVAEIYADAKDRIEKIESGSYDPTEEASEEGYDIPEELLETEEDKRLDELDAEKAEKNKIVDKIFTWAFGAILVGIFVYFFITKVL